MRDSIAVKTQLQVTDVVELYKLGVAMHLLQPASKEPIGKGWRAKRSPLDEILRGVERGCNVAFQMGKPSKTPYGYLHALDADVRDPAKQRDLDAALDAALPESARRFTVKTGSGTGHHHYFFSPEPLASHKLAGGEGWELAVKGTGTYVVAPGSIHDITGLPYEWVSGRRLDPSLLEMVTPPRVALGPLRKVERPAQAAPAEPVPREELQEALDQLTPSELCYDEWKDAGMALHYESGGADWGFDLFDSWSQRDPRSRSDGGYPGEREMRSKWRSFGKGSGAAITGATLLFMARETQHSNFIEQCLAELEDLPELPNHMLGPKAQNDDLSALDIKAQPSALRFLSPDECSTAPRRGYIVKRLLAPGDVAAIVGAPGCGKSTLAPMLGYAVAQGREAFGLRTKPGGVFYVAAEDETGLQMRVAALRREHGPADGFKVVAGVSNLLEKNSPDLLALCNAVKEQRPTLIVIDTLAMAFPGLEENDATAMGRVVKVARSLTRWGAAVVLIHHDTKSGDGLPRGHSVLNGALDVSLALKRDGKTVTGRLTKNRNGPCDLEIMFEIEGAELGTDEDGERITAALCRPMEDSFADLGPVNEKQRAFMSTLYSIGQRDGCDEVAESALRIELDQSKVLSRTDTSDARRKAFDRARDGLLGQGVLSRNPETGGLKPLIPFEVCFARSRLDIQDTSRTRQNVQ